MNEHAFDDLLAGNADYKNRFSLGGFDGIAHAGVAMVTCMDSRIEPLEMIGLRVGDAKIIRTPGVDSPKTPWSAACWASTCSV